MAPGFKSTGLSLGSTRCDFGVILSGRECSGGTADCRRWTVDVPGRRCVTFHIRAGLLVEG